MSNPVSKSSHDEEATSRASSQARQPSWMSHWTKGSSKAALQVKNSSSVCTGDGRGDDTNGTALSRVKLEDGYSKSGKGPSIDPKGMVAGVADDKKRPSFFQSECCVPLFDSASQEIGTTSTMKTQPDHELGPNSVSLALALGREDTSTDVNLLHQNTWRPNGKQPMGHSFEGQKSLALGREGTSTDMNLLRQINWRRNGKQPVYHSSEGQKEFDFPTSGADLKVGSAFNHGSNKADASGPVVVFEKHFSNDNFTCFGQDTCKYKNYSSYLIHETGMKNDPTHHEVRQNNGLHLQHGQSPPKNFQSLFYKQCRSGQNNSTARLLPTHTNLSNIYQQSPHQGSHPTEGVPCFRNVETMRICTMVDSVENSPGGHHEVSQKAHHFLFTKETRLNLSDGHHCEEKRYGSIHASPDVASAKPSGVKIQPLWTSTDSDEKENTGTSSTFFKAGSRNEASAESSGMQVHPPTKQHCLSGMPSSPLHKNDTVEGISAPAACDSSTERTRSQKPVLEIPDINEVVPGLQPAASSTDGEETSTSRVHSLDAKQILSYGKQTAPNVSASGQDRPLGPDTNNRWIKRLKLSSSDSFGVGTKSSDGEGSSHEKCNLFFKKYVKGDRENFEAKLSKHSEGLTSMEQNMESTVSKKRNHSTMRGCSWIQRWCQNSRVPLASNPEPLVICEPRSLKLKQDETAKKHFPSIGALALMGKAMNGFRSCEFRKRGPVVVWNTKEF